MSTKFAEPSGANSIRSSVEPMIDIPIDDSIAYEPPHRSRFRRWPAVLVILVIGGAGAAYYVYHQAATRSKSQTNQAAGETSQQRDGKASLGYVSPVPAANGKQKSASPRFEIVPVEVVPRSDVLRLTGSLMADEKSSVAANTSGIAAEVCVDRGSIVRKGDVLVQIDPTDAKNKLAEGQAMVDELKARLGIDETTENFVPEDEPEVRLAKASAELAGANLKRATDAHARKVISTEAFEQTRTEFELANQRYRQALFQIKQAYQVCKTAQIKLGILQKTLADTTIRAPFDGWVAEKLVAVGEQISSGMQATKVVTLVRVDPLRLSLTVPQQHIGSIQPGQMVRFHVDSFPDRTFEATVRLIAPVVTNDTRSMVVDAMVPNPEGELRPGLFATAELVLMKKANAMFVPATAVQKMGEVARVFVVLDGVAHEQVVAIGQADEQRVEVLSGLSGNETLVARAELVHDGDAVRQ
jgi:RND family efflux transporter MFP subunit